MARRGDPDDLGRKKSAAAEKAEEQEQEALEQQEAQQKSDQTRDAAQDALGNEAVQAMMGVATAKAGEAGQGADLAERKSEEGIGVDYGGDDAPADGPISFEDLVRTWNPGTRRGQDTPPFRDDLSTGDLPEPDPAALALPVGDAPRPPGIRLSPTAIASDLGLAAREAVRLAGDSVLGRSWGFLLQPPRGPVLDPHARVVVVRARVAALTTLLADDALTPLPPEQRAALWPTVSFLLDLATRRKVLGALADRVVADKDQLPRAARLVGLALLGAPDRAASGQSPGVELIEHVKAVLVDLAPRSPALALLPDLPPEVASEEEDDPLGLDAVLGAHTGPAADPLAGRYDLQLLTAEKLAVRCNELRLEAAAAVVATRDALGPAAVPASLHRVADALDAEVEKALQLLVEIARAVQQRSVPPAGVRNGLRRAARALDLAFTQLCGWLAGAVAAAIPPAPGLQLPPLPGADAFDRALEDRDLAAAAAVARGVRDGVAAGYVLGDPDTDAMDLARAARAAGRDGLARAVELLALFRTPYEGLANHLRADALEAGDDLTYAAATMVLLDLSPEPGEVRLDAVAELGRFGPSAGLELLRRWAPPRDDD